jgi:hypothetical protein
MMRAMESLLAFGIVCIEYKTFSTYFVAKIRKAKPQNHDYYSIWFDSTAIFFISQYNLRVSKIKNPYFISSYF